MTRPSSQPSPPPSRRFSSSQLPQDGYPENGYPQSGYSKDGMLFSAAEGPGTKPIRFWAEFFRYRPLIILGGVWLLLICVTAFAYSRLMFAGDTPVTRNTPDRIIPSARPQDDIPFTPSSPATTPSFTSDSSQDALRTPGEDLAESAPVYPQESTDTVPFWSLGLLVGGCALGCWWLHRWAIVPPKPPQSTRNPLPPRDRLARSARPAPDASPRLKRIKPYSSVRDRQVVSPPVAPQSQSPRPSRPAPRDGGLPGPSGMPKPPVAPTFSAKLKPVSPETDVTVMPEDEPLPLDWPEGSLAHTLDIRQRRSLSSFL